MSEKKDIFSEIISEKLEDFEVPYNAEHWGEMSDKLDTMKPLAEVPPTNRINRYIWAGAAAVVSIAALYYFTTLESIEAEIQKPAETENVEMIITEEIAPAQEAMKEEKQENNTNSSPVVSESEDEKKTEKDHGIEHYANLTEDQVKAKSKEDVDQMVSEHASEIPTSPIIDNSELKTNIIIEDNLLCSGSDIQFNIDREIEGAKYYWNFGDKGLTSRKTRPSHEFKRAGTYVVTLIVDKGNIGEKNDFKVEKTVTIEEEPKLTLEKENTIITLNNPYIKFTAECQANCKILWKTNNSVVEGREFEMLIPDKGFYSAEAIATSNNGCASKESIEYNATKGAKMIVEEAFSPNGDGLNDDFIPEELKISNVEFTFVVRDKNGQVLFTSNDKYNAWNGSLNNAGSVLPEDFYFWKVSFTDDRGKVHNQEGKIKLLQR